MEESFKKAQAHLFQEKPDVDNSVKLQIYALFKQATTGNVKGSKPSRLKMVERAKYEAWEKLKNKSKEQAMKEYIQVIQKCCPSFTKIVPKL